MSVTIGVPIPDELLPILERKARSAGLKREEYVTALLSRDLSAPKALGEVSIPHLTSSKANTPDRIWPNGPSSKAVSRNFH